MNMSPKKTTDSTVSHYEIGLVSNEHGGYYARIPDFPTIFTGGKTPEEATRNAVKAIELMIEEYQGRDLAVPFPLVSCSSQSTEER